MLRSPVKFMSSFSPIEPSMWTSAIAGSSMGPKNKPILDSK